MTATTATTEFPAVALRATEGPRPTATRVACSHCGTACAGRPGGRAFCCVGCQTVFELLTENGLDQFYTLNPRAGTRVEAAADAGRYGFLDEPAVRERLVDFTDARTTRVTWSLPAIHCVACVWLLENLHRLQPGIGRTTVNFARREISLAFDPTVVRLSDVAGLLQSLGYPPDLRLSDLDRPEADPVSRRLWLRVGVAGFVFGNTMLFSLPGYFGLDSATGPAFRTLVGWLSLVLALPVVAFSASDYWRTTWISLRQRRLTIDVPIALGIAALFLQSAGEVVLGRGVGYFDSLAGLVFFLLCGRLFQQKTYDRLAFDRDYRSFFPLSAVRRNGAATERVALAQLKVGDRLVLRHGELVPADARLVEGTAVIDYSFVTGEADPVAKAAGEHLYAGGRQTGGSIEIVMVKAVSQSYLASLWNQEAFRKDRDDGLNTITNRYSRRFTWIILGIAAGAAIFWAVREPSRSLRAFTGVLIVACPCALALAAPLTFGAALRSLGRSRIFLRNADVVDALARVDVVVFDKTGTLTAAQGGEVAWHGVTLTREEATWLGALAGGSAHPLSARLATWLEAHSQTPAKDLPGVEGFTETPGGGVAGWVAGHQVALGSAAWVGGGAGAETGPGTSVHVVIDGVKRGRFGLTSALRPETKRLLRGLAEDYEIALLSGDQARDQARFAPLFGSGTRLHFNRTPADKLQFIRELQRTGKRVMMVGDGLNDAGALRQSEVGVAVVEEVGAFSPASDIIMDAALVPRTEELLRFARQSARVVRASFLISTLYNGVGLTIAATGNLSPVVCAILMPLSSVTVAVFAVGVTRWLGRRAGLEAPRAGQSGGLTLAQPKEGGA